MNEDLFDVEQSERPVVKREIAAVAGKSIASDVDVDETLLEVCRPFDYDFNGRSVFEFPVFHAPPRDGSWAIGLIVGPSGTGKSQLLKKNYGCRPPPRWNPRLAIASQLGPPAEASARLAAVGLNSVPAWCRPFHVLSNGEQFRASMARSIASNASFDEFTSVVDRTVAKTCCHAIQRHARNNKLTGIVFVTCHYDVVEWLQPDWVFDTLTAAMLPRGSIRRRPSIRIAIESCDRRIWNMFKHHHYLSSEILQNAETFTAFWDESPIGFTSCVPFPHGHLRNAWREHRTVILPDYQGLGIGVRLSDWLGERCLSMGRKFYSRTSHPRMGEYRERSPLWTPNGNNRTANSMNESIKGGSISHGCNFTRVCFSHKYVGRSRTTAPQRKRS